MENYVTSFDQEEITLSDDFVVSLEHMMRAMCEMMQEHEPDLADCWTWGRCYVRDLAYNKLDFLYGGDDDFPRDGLGRFAVVVKRKSWQDSDE